MEIDSNTKQCLCVYHFDSNNKNYDYYYCVDNKTTTGLSPSADIECWTVNSTLSCDEDIFKEAVAFATASLNNDDKEATAAAILLCAGEPGLCAVALQLIPGEECEYFGPLRYTLGWTA